MATAPASHGLRHDRAGSPRVTRDFAAPGNRRDPSRGLDHVVVSHRPRRVPGRPGGHAVGWPTPVLGTRTWFAVTVRSRRSLAGSLPRPGADRTSRPGARIVGRGARNLVRAAAGRRGQAAEPGVVRGRAGGLARELADDSDAALITDDVGTAGWPISCWAASAQADPPLHTARCWLFPTSEVARTDAASVVHVPESSTPRCRGRTVLRGCWVHLSTRPARVAGPSRPSLVSGSGEFSPPVDGPP